VVSQKYQWLCISRHGIISQKTWIFKMTAAPKAVICKPEGTNPPGRSRRNIKRDIKEKWCDGVAWIHLAQNCQPLWASAYTAMKLMRSMECLFQRSLFRSSRIPLYWTYCLLQCYYYYYYYHRISHFSVLAGKYSAILGFSNQQD
jgi:hypothetical protein